MVGGARQARQNKSGQTQRDTHTHPKKPSNLSSNVQYTRSQERNYYHHREPAPGCRMANDGAVNRRPPRRPPRPIHHPLPRAHGRVGGEQHGGRRGWHGSGRAAAAVSRGGRPPRPRQWLRHRAAEPRRAPSAPHPAARVLRVRRMAAAVPRHRGRILISVPPMTTPSAASTPTTAAAPSTATRTSTATASATTATATATRMATTTATDRYSDAGHGHDGYCLTAMASANAIANGKSPRHHPRLPLDVRPPPTAAGTGRCLRGLAVLPPRHT